MLRELLISIAAVTYIGIVIAAVFLLRCEVVLK